MTNAVLTKLADERSGLVDFIDTTMGQASEAGRDLVDTELATLKSTQERMAQIDAQMGPLQEFEKLRASAVKIDRATGGSGIQLRQREAYPAAQDDESMGALFIGSDQFR